jgi:hypothetical protein
VLVEGCDSIYSGLRHVIEIGDVVERTVDESIGISLAPPIQCSTFECNDRFLELCLDSCSVPLRFGSRTGADAKRIFSVGVPERRQGVTLS